MLFSVSQLTQESRGGWGIELHIKAFKKKTVLFPSFIVFKMTNYESEAYGNRSYAVLLMLLSSA